MVEAYPRPKGSITASCGHEIDSFDDGMDVCYRSEDCDADTDFHRAVAFAVYCIPCAQELERGPDWIATDEEASAWLTTGAPRH